MNMDEASDASVSVAKALRFIGQSFCNRASAAGRGSSQLRNIPQLCEASTYGLMCMASGRCG